MSWRKDFRLPYFHLSKISDSLLYHINISVGASLTADIPETEHKNIEQMLHIRITLMHLVLTPRLINSHPFMQIYQLGIHLP